jgi:hypothetical protein
VVHSLIHSLCAYIVPGAHFASAGVRMAWHRAGCRAVLIWPVLLIPTVLIRTVPAA